MADKTFTVTWETKVTITNNYDGLSPLSAARAARQAMMDPDRAEATFTVVDDETGKVTKVTTEVRREIAISSKEV